MNGADLVKQLNKRIAARSGKLNLKPAELAEALGVSPQTITNWQSSKELRAADVSNVVIKALEVARAKVENEAIKPVVEFFRIDTSESRHGAKMELFSTAGNGGDAHPYRDGLRKKLE